MNTSSGIAADAAIDSAGSEVELLGGGVSNTEELSSFAIGMDGTFPVIPDLEYHLAYIHQEKGTVDSADENGFALGATYSIMTSGLEIYPFVEFVYFDNADGVDGINRYLLTTSLQLVWEHSNLALSRTSRDTDGINASDAEDKLYQISIGYEFEPGLSMALGWRVAEEGDINSKTLGLRFSYNLPL